MRDLFTVRINDAETEIYLYTGDDMLFAIKSVDDAQLIGDHIASVINTYTDTDTD